MDKGHLKLFWVLLLFAKICLTTQETVSVLIDLDANCTANHTDGSSFYYPRSRAFESLNFFLSEVDASLEPDTCCCSVKNITCRTNSTRDILSPFFEYIYGHASIFAGTFIANISLLNPSDRMNEPRIGETSFICAGENYTIHHTNYHMVTMSLGPNQTEQTPLTQPQVVDPPLGPNQTDQTPLTQPQVVDPPLGPNQTDQTPLTQPQVGDPPSRVAAAVGGTLGALGALGALLPLSYYMYKRLKKSNQVDDTNSTTGLFGATPVVGFEEAPNSEPPAGTG